MYVNQTLTGLKMPKLEFISDKALRDETAFVIKKALNAKNESENKFGKNVIDPFATLFEFSGFDVDHTKWKDSETVRQAQKTLQNHVGAFHQRILGHVEGWDDKKTGVQVDLICDSKKIIAEVKNKYSTVTGGSLVNVYDELSDLVTRKSSKYKDYTAYFVTIIPKHPIRFNNCFTPSNKKKGTKCEKNELIRITDGSSFYALVTGRENALEELYGVLPTVIEEIFAQDYKKSAYVVPNKTELLLYFNAAFKNTTIKKTTAKKAVTKRTSAKKAAAKKALPKRTLFSNLE